MDPYRDSALHTPGHTAVRRHTARRRGTPGGDSRSSPLFCSYRSHLRVMKKIMINSLLYIELLTKYIYWYKPFCRSIFMISWKQLDYFMKITIKIYNDQMRLKSKRITNIRVRIYYPSIRNSFSMFLLSNPNRSDVER